VLLNDTQHIIAILTNPAVANENIKHPAFKRKADSTSRFLSPRSLSSATMLSYGIHVLSVIPFKPSRRSSPEQSSSYTRGHKSDAMRSPIARHVRFRKCARHEPSSASSFSTTRTIVLSVSATQLPPHRIPQRTLRYRQPASLWNLLICANSNSQPPSKVLPCLLILRVNRNPERKTEDGSKENEKRKGKSKRRAGSQGLGPELRRDAMLNTRRQLRTTNGRSRLASRHPSCIISNRHIPRLEPPLSHSKQRTGTLPNRNKTALFICRGLGDFR
jgi:hypothetical protein